MKCCASRSSPRTRRADGCVQCIQRTFSHQSHYLDHRTFQSRQLRPDTFTYRAIDGSRECPIQGDRSGDERSGKQNEASGAGRNSAQRLGRYGRGMNPCAKISRQGPVERGTGRTVQLQRRRRQVLRQGARGRRRSRSCRCSKDPCAQKVSGRRADPRPKCRWKVHGQGTDQHVGMCERADRR